MVVQKRKAVGISCEASVVIDRSVPWLDMTMGATAELGGQWPRNILEHQSVFVQSVFLESVIIQSAFLESVFSKCMCNALHSTGEGARIEIY